ncbi:MAG: cytochrome C [Cyclobacteriaceae bacterium]
MDNNRFDILDSLKKITTLLIGIMSIMVMMVLVSIFAIYFDTPEQAKVTEARVESKVTKAPESQESVLDITGLADDPNIQIIAANCTACHSAKLVTQNRATREGWKSMIQWMQKTQNLWELGKNEDIILDYLAKNYAPENKGRRPPLENIEWYELTQ